MLDQINIVLSHTSHPGNIGATARAMKVMGLTKLILINPKNFPSDEATSRASNAYDILDAAIVCSTLEQAITDSRLIIGASARTRSMPSKLVTPRMLTEVIKNDLSRTPISIVFGTENSGLTNDELNHCHYHVYIPTNPDYSSLNLASAVQLIAYEMRLAFSEIDEIPKVDLSKNDQVITREELSGVLQHFEQVMLETGYLVPEQEKYLGNRMNNLFNKSEITLSEMNILRGFLTSVTNYAKRLQEQK